MNNMTPEAQRIAIDNTRVTLDCNSMNEQRMSERFWSKVSVVEDSRCWLWNGSSDVNGYGKFRASGRTIRAPRVAFFLRNSRWPNNACHRCDNPRCCNPDHIFDGTHAENMRDMAEKGRAKTDRGEAHWRAVLTDAKVIAMRADYKSGTISLYRLAAKNGCSFSTAQRVIKRTNWRHLP